ncbi:MAG: hypothetical protein H6R10_1394 [Rhodocyclaceae bacterium]|nr:hypothetical protein [Rhodocyclaceae bacterium]
MIPADVASRLRLITPDQPAPAQPALPAKQLTDVLSDLVPGQRIMAEIQSLLPNGTYRAMVAQRDVTLALPFSAKAGDALELEVVESDGKLTLAFVTNRSQGDQAQKGAESVSATLSQTGKLIGQLLGNIDDRGKGSQAAPLNGNQPLLSEVPKDAAQLAPVLKEALAKSGMFYEAHQARWAEGKLPTEALLQEPQGKYSAPLHAQPMPGSSDGSVLARGTSPADSGAAAGTSPATSSAQPSSMQGAIPSDLAPLVRQQLDALATQNYAWQGQVWPGQQMYWEIEEDGGNRQATEDDSGQQWRTRLKLTLPILGGIDAVMRLRTGGAVDISLVTDSDESRQKLIAGSEALRRQLADAGLDLTALAVQHGETPP